MYLKDEMILWSIIFSLTIKTGKVDTLLFNSNCLFEIFRKSIELNKNIFHCSYNERKSIIKTIDSLKEIEKLEELFNDFVFLKSLKNQVKVENEIMRQENIKMVTYQCSDYPSDLRYTKLPPYVLYYKGSFPKEKNLKESLAIIGTRHPEIIEDKEFIENIGLYLKRKNGYNISGLALGCDEIGHRVTLEIGVKNIAILGQGLGTFVYPKENEKLAIEIIKKDGALISEISPSISIKSIYLLNRNRLQVYLSKGICILESGSKGGTMTTLKYAIKEKRKVFIRNVEKNIEIFKKNKYKNIYFINSKEDIEKIDFLGDENYKLFN